MSQPILWTKNTGRNGFDPPIAVPLTQSVESRNVYLYKGGLGTRRGGSTSITITGVSAPIFAIGEFQPTSPTTTELWLVDSSTPIKILRCAGGASFTNETLVDNVTQTIPAGVGVCFATLNGKLWIAYQSGVNRMHVFDPNNASTNTVRRGGLKAFGSAPTVANTGSGSYAAVARYYVTRSIEQQSGIVNRRSEASPVSTVFTQIGRAHV